MEDQELVNEWLDEVRASSTKALYQYHMSVFQEYWKQPLEQFLALEPKAMRHTVLKFQNYLKERRVRKTKRNLGGELMSANSIVGTITALASFCRTNDKPLAGMRGKWLRRQIDLDSHVFSNGELSHMFDVGNPEEKAILATFCSLGWEVSSILELKRDFIRSLLANAKQQGKEFVYFQSQRPKTNALRLGVLNPLALEWLDKWLTVSEGQTEKLFMYESEEGLNKMLRRLAKNANIANTGRIHSHLIRKWVMSGLSRSGFNEFQIKYLLGKTIPISDMTYLQTLQIEVEQRYPKAYEYLNIKPARIVTVVDQELKQKVEALERENRELREKAKLKDQDLEGRLAKMETLLKKLQEETA